MLRMITFQVGYPMRLFILMESDDLSFHGWSPRKLIGSPESAASSSSGWSHEIIKQGNPSCSLPSEGARHLTRKDQGAHPSEFD
jgi:hypothetical protein